MSERNSLFRTKKTRLTMTVKQLSKNDETIVTISNSLPKYFWVLLILFCLLSSVIVQFALPFIQELLKSSICLNILLSDSTKKTLGCIPTTIEKHPSLKKTTNVKKITYFDDPFPIEPWSRDEDNANSADLRLSLLPRIKYQIDTSPWREQEALAALQIARRSREGGNIRKAEAIIEHALTLAPQHPDILTEYGIFVETVKNNVLEAEGLYRKALILNPTHTEALIRREKTLPLVEEIDNNMLNEIRRKRDIFLQIPRWNPGLKRAMRDSYFQHIYHTVALEGNTFTLIQTRSILETKLAIAGKSIIEHNEILGMDAALRFLNQSLAHLGNIQIDDILAIHKRVLGFVDPIVAGVLRTTQVYVGSFTPTPPEDVHDELLEMIEWLNDEDTLRLDPVELAAIAHYKLVYIHPFIDGNGRTARLLMNFILMQAGYPPVIIPVDERNTYYSTLKSANEGDLRPFIRFIARLTNSCLQSFISSSTICNPSDCPDLESSQQNKKSSVIIETP